MDHMVYDTKSGSKFGELEVKTCTKAGSLNLSVEGSVVHSSFKSGHFLVQKGNRIILYLTHIYIYIYICYYLVQGQLALTALDKLPKLKQLSRKLTLSGMM